MIYTTENDILFDDHSILTKLTGQNTMVNASANSDCDCSGYTSTSNLDDLDTNQIAPSAGQTH